MSARSALRDLQALSGRADNRDSVDCPRCHTPMLVQYLGTQGDLEVDVCAPCGVMWLDGGELDRLDESMRSHLRHLRLDEIGEEELGGWTPGRCPRCGQASYRDVGGSTLQVIAPVAEPELLLEICPSCRGVLLEEGQLERFRNLLFRLDSEQTHDRVIWLRVNRKTGGR